MKKILFFLFITNVIYSQNLDNTFDGDGILYKQISNTGSSQVVFDGLVQPDGKVVLCGKYTSHSTNGFVARFKADGTKDATFNLSGFRSFGVQGYQSIALLNDGKYIVAGRNIVTKLNSDGTLDTSFNTTGGFSMTIGGQNMNIKKVSVQADNKIVISGYLYNGVDTDFIIARLNPDGSLDNFFNFQGYIIIPVGTTNNAYSHQIQSDGKIVVVGDSFNSLNNNYDFCVLRLDVNGQLDTSFGLGGVVTTGFGLTSKDQARELRIMPSGKIFVVGASDGKLAFVQYNSDGSLDTNYAAGGKYISPYNISYSITSGTLASANSFHILPKITADSNGKTLIGFSSDNDFKVMRLLTDNLTLDSSFSGGVATQNANYDVVSFLGVKSNGKIMTGGYSSNSIAGVANPDASIKMIELNANGSLFSSSTKELFSIYDLASYTTISPIDQSIFTLTTSIVDGSYVITVSKYLSNGVADTTFGTNGVFVLTGVNETPPAKIIVLSDGKLIVPTGNFTSLYKLNSNGTLDTTFGTNGILNLNTIDPNIIYIDTIVLSNDNKFLIGVDYSNIASSSDNAIIKLNQDGTLDTSFGTNGIVVYRFDSDQAVYEFPTALVQESNGKIIVTSIGLMPPALTFATNTKIRIARLNSNGMFDSSFATTGKIMFDLGQSLVPERILKTASNEYLINFYLYPNNVATTSKTLKLNYNGSINTSYGVNGVADDVVNSLNFNMELQNDDKLIKVGRKNNQFCVSRYLPSGAIDTSFGVNGEKIESVGLISSKTSDVNILPGGKLLVTGDSFDGDVQRLTFVKYTDLYLGTINFSIDNASLLVYPNPIENVATFEYDLHNSETITIDLVDISGRIIKAIENKSLKSAGNYKIQLNLEGLNSGLYFIRINAENKGNQTIKVIKK